MSPKEWCVIIWIICGFIAFVGTAIMDRRKLGPQKVSLMDIGAGIISGALLGPGFLIMFLIALADEIEFKL